MNGTPCGFLRPSASRLLTASGLDRRSLLQGSSPSRRGSLGIPRASHTSSRRRTYSSHHKQATGPHSRTTRPLPRSEMIRHCTRTPLSLHITYDRGSLFSIGRWDGMQTNPTNAETQTKQRTPRVIAVSSSPLYLHYARCIQQLLHQHPVLHPTPCVQVLGHECSAPAIRRSFWRSPCGCSTPNLI